MRFNEIVVPYGNKKASQGHGVVRTMYKARSKRNNEF